MDKNNKQGGTLTLIKIAYRNIWRNKRRTAFCFSAVGMAVFFMVMYTALIDGMTNNMDLTVQVFELGHVNVVSSQFEAERELRPVWHPIGFDHARPDGKSVDELVSAISRIPGVVAVFPRITAFATLQESTLKHATLWGLDIRSETALNNFDFAARTDGLVEGSWPRSEGNEVAVGSGFAQRTGLGIGDRIPLRTMSAQFSDRFWSPVITGIFHFEYSLYNQQFIVADFNRLQRLLTMGEGTQQLIIFADDPRRGPAIAVSVQNLLGQYFDTADHVVTAWQDSFWVAMMNSVQPIYFAMFMVFLIVASFLVINTMTMVIHERIKEIGMMGSLGMTRREIVSVFFFESSFLAFFGALCGVVLGGLFAFIGSHFPIRFDQFYGDLFSDIPMGALFMDFNVATLIRSWIVGVVATSLFTLIPSLRSARVEPVEALRR